MQKEKKRKFYLGQASCSDLNEHGALLIFEKFTEINFIINKICIKEEAYIKR